MPCNSYSYTSDDGTCSLAFLKKDQFMEKEVQDADNTNIFLNGSTNKTKSLIGPIGSFQNSSIQCFC